MTDAVRIGLVPPDDGHHGDGGNAVVRQRLRLREFPPRSSRSPTGGAGSGLLDLYTLGGAKITPSGWPPGICCSIPAFSVRRRVGPGAGHLCGHSGALGHWWRDLSRRARRRRGSAGRNHLTPAGAHHRGWSPLPLIDGLSEPLTGFETTGGNHSGPDARPLAAVVKGGKPAGDGVDGAVQGSVFATYLHRAVPARNPQFADLLLSRWWALPPLDLPEVEQLRRERLVAPRRV